MYLKMLIKRAPNHVKVSDVHNLIANLIQLNDFLVSITAIKLKCTELKLCQGPSHLYSEEEFFSSSTQKPESEFSLYFNTKTNKLPREFSDPI